jgi:uncharacterized protein (DUF2141 family)
VYKIGVVFFWSLLVLSCAQQGILTGGDKDTQPPIVDTNRLESPLNGSVNFNSDQIEISFNEYIVLNDPKKQIIITPFLSIQPNIFVKGKKVIIQFKCPLEENTTYIINFGDAIKDITEGNTLQNYKYVFSTGSFIDSLKYQAFVYDAYSKKPAPEALVMLYKNLDDSVVMKQKPIYFAKTDRSGKCVVDNIAKGVYKVFVLQDGNGNYLFDQTSEKIGFPLNTLSFSSDTSAINCDTIGIFKDVPNKNKIVSSSFKNGKITLSLNTPNVKLNDIRKASFNVFNDSIRSFFINGEFEHNRTFDTLSFWLKPQFVLNQDIELEVIDYGKTKVKVVSPSETRKVSFTTNAINDLKPTENLSINFDEPIKNIDSLQISLKKNDQIIPFSITKKGLQEVEIKANWEEDELYEFSANPNFITSYYENTNDSIQLIFSKNNLAKYGSVKVSLSGKTISEHTGSFIVLVSQNNKVIYKMTPPKKDVLYLPLDNLIPGNYEFCIIFDTNNNGVWDTGNYLSKIQPERIEYYSDPIEIRKGWDSEIVWKIEK